MTFKLIGNLFIVKKNSLAYYAHQYTTVGCIVEEWNGSLKKLHERQRKLEFMQRQLMRNLENSGRPKGE